MPNVPAIYELNENGEATGTVHFFCSDRCLNHQIPNPFGTQVHNFGIGVSEVPDPQTICETCGKTLETNNEQ
jgi:hypothetical protein